MLNESSAGPVLSLTLQTSTLTLSVKRQFFPLDDEEKKDLIEMLVLVMMSGESGQSFKEILQGVCEQL